MPAVDAPGMVTARQGGVAHRGRVGRVWRRHRHGHPGRGVFKAPRVAGARDHRHGGTCKWFCHRPQVEYSSAGGGSVEPWTILGQIPKSIRGAPRRPRRASATPGAGFGGCFKAMRGGVTHRGRMGQWWDRFLVGELSRVGAAPGAAAALLRQPPRRVEGIKARRRPRRWLLLSGRGVLWSQMGGFGRACCGNPTQRFSGAVDSQCQCLICQYRQFP